MNFLKSKIASIALLTIMMIASAVTSDLGDSNNTTVIDEKGGKFISASQLFGWANEPWTGDNEPYHTVRTEIDKAEASGQNVSAIAQHYQSLYSANPANTVHLFGWAYASNALAHQNMALAKMRTFLRPVTAVLDESTFPNTYDFARIKFLIENVYLSWQQYRDLGERLIKKDPNDYITKYQLALLLLEAFPKPDFDRALRYLHQIMVQNSNNPRPYYLVGEIYLLQYEQTRNRNYSDKLISAYRDYLQRASANDAFRTTAERIIKSISQP